MDPPEYGKPVLLKKTDFNQQPFEEEDFYLDELWNRQISSGAIDEMAELIIETK